MTDLVAWLTVQLDHDERVALACFRSRLTASGPRVESVEPPGAPVMPIADMIDAETARHFALHDPARVLREVAAHRAILLLHGDSHECSTFDHHGEVDSCTWVSEPGGCSTLRLLASIYSDRPGYDPAWAPPND